MTLEEIVIALVRIVGSLLVLRWAFAGGVVAVLVDLSDLFLRSYLSLGGVRDYQAFDKWLDQVYMLTFLAVALRWHGPPRQVAVALYAFRLAGFVAFELSGARGLLLFFPNVFEFWFLFVAAQRHWRPAFRFERSATALALVLLTLAKEFQEYALHGARWLDSFTARDVGDFVLGLLGL